MKLPFYILDERWPVLEQLASIVQKKKLASMLNRVMVKIRGETTFYSNKVVSQLSKEKTQ